MASGVCFYGYPAWWLLACFSALLTLLVLGSIQIRWNFYFYSVNRLPLAATGKQPAATGNLIALTFDDGPAEYTAAILDILAKEQVSATFFIIGKNIAGREELLRRMRSEGHSIGNHSYHHGFNFDWQSASVMLGEIKRTNESIEAVTGLPVTLFRPPYGVTNPNLGKALRNSGLRSIGWSVRSMDTVAKDEQQLLEKILTRVKTRDIILLHDRCSITAAILPKLIGALKKHGFTFATF